MNANVHEDDDSEDVVAIVDNRNKNETFLFPVQEEADDDDDDEDENDSIASLPLPFHNNNFESPWNADTHSAPLIAQLSISEHPFHHGISTSCSSRCRQ